MVCALPSSASLQVLIAQTHSLPAELASTGLVTMPHTQLKQLIGRLLAQRYNVHLLSDILDTPDFFWEQRPELTELCSLLSRHARAISLLSLVLYGCVKILFLNCLLI